MRDVGECQHIKSLWEVSNQEVYMLSGMVNVV